MPSDPRYLAKQKEQRAARRAAGVCVECGAPRAPHDPRLCARHREAARANHRTTYQRSVGRPVTNAVESHPPRDPGTVCPQCYDMPWRRPLRKPCACGGRRGVEVVRYDAEWCWRHRETETWE